MNQDDEVCNFISRNNFRKDDFFEDKEDIGYKYTFDEDRTNSLIKNLNEKWNEIEKNKKRTNLKQSQSIKDIFKDNRKYTNTSVSSNNKKIVFKRPVIKKSKIEEDNEFENFMKIKVKQLEKFKTGFHFENKKTDFLFLKKEKDSFLTDKKEKSFIKKDNIEINIEEILNPSKNISTKMNNIYEMIATSQDKVEEDYSMTALENDFGKLISKINPSNKNKTLFEKPTKERHTHTNVSNNKICEKNNFESFQVNSRLKRILNK